MREPKPVPFRGYRGFDTLSTPRLIETLTSYKELRDHERTPSHVRRYARRCIQEIHEELRSRREGKGRAA